MRMMHIVLISRKVKKVREKKILKVTHHHARLFPPLQPRKLLRDRSRKSQRVSEVNEIWKRHQKKNNLRRLKRSLNPERQSLQKQSVYEEMLLRGSEESPTLMLRSSLNQVNQFQISKKNQN